MRTGSADQPADSASAVSAARRCSHVRAPSIPKRLTRNPFREARPAAAAPALAESAVWLAERGYRVTALDWQVEALDMGRRLADSRGTACDFRAVDLREPGSVPPGPWSIVLDFRYLDRPLLATFPRLVAPGGVAVVRTFRDAPGYEGHPRPRHRLASWELTRAFPRGEWEVLAHEQGFDPDGRPAAGIVARRRD